MPTSSKPRPNGRPRRRGTKSETRERLVAAALELLHSGGAPAVSTVSVTRGAGIVQSAFYQHFRNTEECLAVVAERSARHIREAVAAARREMYQSPSGTGKELEEFYRAVFELVSRQRPLMELFLRYRGDPLALGGVMHRLARDLCSDLARDLAEQLARAGAPALPAGWVETVADNLMGASFSAVEAIQDGRGPGVEESARLLAAFTNGACLGVLATLRTGAP